jgi:xylulose-5-phosphate/fructose-6-phosphate phosphoketolase
MLYLRENPLLREPFKPEQIKRRLLDLLGLPPRTDVYLGSSEPAHHKVRLDMISIAGPGHGAPATLSNSYLEGVYSEVDRLGKMILPD